MKILEQIRPTEIEIRKTGDLIHSVLKKIKIPDAKLELGGSYAKNTFLAGNYDIDVFVKFPYTKYKNKDISKILIDNLNLRKKVVHGSRDYIQITKGKYVFEFIPVLDIKDSSKAKNITDVSPLHKDWVKKHIKNTDDVRLLKKFCRAANVYGAESYIKGFSGYVLEILTYHYKDFFNLIKNISQWKIPVFIDPMKHYKTKSSAHSKLNKSKKTDLIIIDPTDKTRNAAAATSNEKIEMFIQRCKEYLHNPSDDFFVEKRINLIDLKTKAGINNLIILKVKTKKGKRDVIGNKVLKVYDYIKTNITKEGFNIIDSNWEFDKTSLIYFIVSNESISEHKIHYGPPVSNKKHREEFKKKWKKHKIHKSNGKYYINLKRKHTKIKPFLKELIKSSYIKSNIKRISVK
jgi:tRNA nucleotidyltransferase (CCA-adding enzyme)